MAGLKKQEEYNWKDSNLALFGSDVEKQVKLESAQSEPAWENPGKVVGLEIWRIVKFQVERWPKADYGRFFEGDSYIILNTYKIPDEDALEYDLHFWIGKYSTQDEYGTAAYKTVELDTFHSDKPIQHREVQYHESKLFKGYFKEGITYLKGGADSGFRHVKPTEYTPRLFIFHGDTVENTVINELELIRQNLNEDDVFVLDAGLTIYQINGPKCDKDEKVKAMYYVSELRAERNGKPKVEVIDDDPLRDRDVLEILKDGDADSLESQKPIDDNTRKLIRISDADGELKMETVAEGEIEQRMLDPNDVFLVDLGTHLYVWVGDDASKGESQNGLSYASNYLNGVDRFSCPITVVSQGRAAQLYQQLS